MSTEIKKQFNIGYTTGVFDLFHIGHLNILRRAKEMCEYLIVGVSTDELVQEYKQKKPVIPFKERVAIVGALHCVDKVVAQINRDKMQAYEEHRFDAMFHGDDWKDDELFKRVEKELNRKGVAVIYFPYTKQTSSTLLKSVIQKI